MPPEEIYHVSQSIFSVARHYGGCRINGVMCFYDPTRDVLIRADVLKARAKQKKPQPRQEQLALLAGDR